MPGTRLRAGNPFTCDATVGPLLDEAQAEHCLNLIHQAEARVLSGGSREGNLLVPTLVETSSPDSRLVKEGFFGCALWIASGTAEDFVFWWRRNKYPLCAGVLSETADAVFWQERLCNLARLTINGDTSEEYVHEPWGGYALSGFNAVSQWKYKYQRIVQTDQPQLRVS